MTGGNSNGQPNSWWSYMFCGGLLRDTLYYSGCAFLIYGTAPWIMTSLGFTSAGIAKCSVAAWWQSLYGGKVLAGSTFSALQSSGAVGAFTGGVSKATLAAVPCFAFGAK